MQKSISGVTKATNCGVKDFLPYLFLLLFSIANLQHNLATLPLWYYEKFFFLRSVCIKPETP